jgi:hypothetical protein
MMLVEEYRHESHNVCIGEHYALRYCRRRGRAVRIAQRHLRSLTNTKAEMITPIPHHRLYRPRNAKPIRVISIHGSQKLCMRRSE